MTIELRALSFPLAFLVDLTAIHHRRYMGPPGFHQALIGLLHRFPMLGIDLFVIAIHILCLCVHFLINDVPELRIYE